MATINGTPAVAPPPRPIRTATPRYAAFRPLRSSGAGTQRWQLLLYPTPSDTMSLSLRYKVAPDQISDYSQFPLGGRHHAETILASCLAIAEEREGPIRDMQPGTYYAKFMQKLAASIHIDKQSAKAEELTWDEGNVSDSGQIQGQIGLHMGFGQNSLAWTETQKRQIEEAMRRGLRRFYIPPPIAGQKRSHAWSFLNPLAAINLVPGQYEYDLPQDFGALDSPLTYAPGTNVLYPDVRVVGEQQVRRLLQASIQANGRPTQAATRVKSGIQEGGTRYEIVFWPVPDGAYSLQYRYQVAPGDSLSVVHGGSPHIQTILEACLCEADAMMNKRYRQHEERFMERLIASVHYDQALASPKTLGYNRDRSDGWGRHVDDDVSRAGNSQSGVTYNGVRY
jgi:hypothetical protein